MAIVAGAGSGLAASAGRVEAAAPCPADSDPAWSAFSGTPAEVAACGLIAYQLTGTARLADGGTPATYAIPGAAPINENVPPAGFDPLTATASELSQYGLSPEPPASEPEAQAHWLSMVGHMKTPAAATPFLVGVPGVHNSYGSGTYTSDNWSGYMDIEPSGYFHYAYGEFVQPYDNANNCSQYAETTWTGVGGRTSNNFGQDGTFIGNKKGLNDYQSWVEVPAIEAMVSTSIYATAGQDFEADTNYSSGQYNWFMENYYTGVYGNFWQSTSAYSGDSDEWIGERVTSVTPYLSNFGNFTWVYAAAAAQQNPVNAYPNDQVILRDNGTPSGLLMAEPGPLNATGYSFPDYWYNCS
jgi:hypothetical protein